MQMMADESAHSESCSSPWGLPTLHSASVACASGESANLLLLRLPALMGERASHAPPLPPEPTILSCRRGWLGSSGLAPTRLTLSLGVPLQEGGQLQRQIQLAAQGDFCKGVKFRRELSRQWQMVCWLATC